FVAAPIAFHRGALVGIEMVINSVKGRLHQLLQLLIAVSVLGLMYVFVTEGWFLTQNAGIQRAFTVNVSIYWVYIVMPVGSALMALVAVELLIAALKGLLDPSRARPRAAADRPLSE
ncbi:MAG: TRAP transporter small permease subunit, partial [Alphaproteobacteria bacterium]|nr:TRAP transporter small permease subunit [Alphaproteobacteria bacterium]